MLDVFAFALIVLALVAWFLDYRHNQPIFRLVSFGALAVSALIVYWSSQSTEALPSKPQLRLSPDKALTKPVLKPIAAPIVNAVPESEPELIGAETQIATRIELARYTVAYPLRVLFGDIFDSTQFKSEFRSLEELAAKGAWAEVEAALNSLFVRVASSRMQNVADLEAPFDMLAGIALLEQDKAQLAVRKFRSAIKSYEIRSGSEVAIVRAKIEMATAIFASGGEVVELSGNPAGVLMQNKSRNLHELALLYRVRALMALANNQKNLAQT